VNLYQHHHGSHQLAVFVPQLDRDLTGVVSWQPLPPDLRRCLSRRAFGGVQAVELGTEKPAEKGRPSVTQITVCGQARVYIRRTAPDFSWAISVIDRLGRNRGEPDAGSQLAQKLE
jgi:hypothetical protein